MKLICLLFRHQRSHMLGTNSAGQPVYRCDRCKLVWTDG